MCVYRVVCSSFDFFFRLCVPLLAVVGALGTGGAALVAGVTGDTVKVVSVSVAVRWRLRLAVRSYPILAAN